MEEMTLEVTLSGYWLCGSGKGDGPGADELPILTPDGTPFLPGRTLRGLLRAAAELLTEARAYSEGVVERLFGSSPLGENVPTDSRALDMELGRNTTEKGTLFVGSATLGRTQAEREAWQRFAREDEDDRVSKAFIRLGSTRIGKEGVADDKTLRTFEVVVPMTLYAEAQLPAERVGLLRDAAALVRELGSGRNRGFGRASITVTKKQRSTRDA